MPTLNQITKASLQPKTHQQRFGPNARPELDVVQHLLFWMSDVHSMGGYVVAASFFALSLASWRVLLCLLLGICIVQLCANLVAKPSQMAGVPCLVICRQATGVFGANIPAVIHWAYRFYGTVYKPIWRLMR